MERQQAIKTNQGLLQRETRPAVKPTLPARAPVHPLLQLQRMLGNQALGCFIQAKLEVNQPGDVYEQEADRVAEQVMRMPEPMPSPLSTRASPDLQRKCPACASGQGLCPKCAEEEKMVHRKPLASQITPLIQRQATEEPEEDEEETLQAKQVAGWTPVVSPLLESHINSIRGGGQPLPESVRAFFEPRFGYDFSQVRVHTDARAAESARAVNALAYTVGRDIMFGAGQYTPSNLASRLLLAHELVHTIQQNAVRATTPSTELEVGKTDGSFERGSHRVADFVVPAISVGSPQNQGLIQRAEVDDNPVFCFPPGGTPLRDSSSDINNWVAAARGISERDAISMATAVYRELGTGTGVTKVEEKLAVLPRTQVRHVSMGESRYAQTGLWPVDPLSQIGLLAFGKIFVSPVINLCGVCVGTDKVGHFFQQGYEYFRLGQRIRARVEGMSLQEKKNFLARLQGPPVDIGVDLGVERVPFIEFELSEGAYPELIATAFAAQFGLWLEGFNHRLSNEDIRWIKSLDFIPWYYSEGIYGRETTGVLSRADLQANQQGYWFYRDLWTNPSRTPNICDYVGELWNERRELSTFVEYLGTPRGPASSSMEAERP